MQQAEDDRRWRSQGCFSKVEFDLLRCLALEPGAPSVLAGGPRWNRTSLSGRTGESSVRLYLHDGNVKVLRCRLPCLPCCHTMYIFTGYLTDRSFVNGYLPRGKRVLTKIGNSNTCPGVQVESLFSCIFCNFCNFCNPSQGCSLAFPFPPLGLHPINVSPTWTHRILLLHRTRQPAPFNNVVKPLKKHMVMGTLLPANIVPYFTTVQALSGALSRVDFASCRKLSALPKNITYTTSHLMGTFLRSYHLRVK